MKKEFFRLTTLLPAFCLSTGIYAAQPETQTLATLISAEPVERAAPKYPLNAAKRGHEGWVRVSFVIDEEGNVKDPIVHDSSGLKSFEKAALKAVKKWKYSPAKLDGEPVEQCDSKVQLDFKLSNDEKGVTRKFLRQYRALKDAIVEADMALADELFAEFGEVHYNMAESLHAAVVSAMYYEAKGNQNEMIRQLEIISSQGHRYLNDEAYFALASKLLLRRIENNQIAEVLELIDLINKHVDEDTQGFEVVKNLKNKVDAHIKNSEQLIVKGKVEDERAWHHKLLLNKFDLISQDAPLERIEIRCQNKRSTYGGVKQQGFIIPESWGQCHIYVDAAPGTAFSLVEYAS